MTKLRYLSPYEFKYELSDIITYKDGFSEINYITGDNGCKIPSVLLLAGEGISIFDEYEFFLSPLPCLKEEAICNPVFSVDDSGCKVSSLHCTSPIEFNVTKKFDTTEKYCFVDDDSCIAQTYFIMDCNEYPIPDLYIGNDMTCDINYEYDEHGCEIPQINCIKNSKTSFSLPTTTEEPTEKTIDKTIEKPTESKTEKTTASIIKKPTESTNEKSTKSPIDKSIEKPTEVPTDNKEIDKKPTEDADESSEEEEGEGEEENSKTTTISKSDEPKEMDETPTEDVDESSEEEEEEEEKDSKSRTNSKSNQPKYASGDKKA